MHCNSCRKLLETTAWVAEGLQPASCAHSLWSKGEDRHPRMYPHWVDSHIVQLPPTCECAARAQPQSCHCCITPILRCQTVHPHCRQQGKKKKSVGSGLDLHIPAQTAPADSPRDFHEHLLGAESLSSSHLSICLCQPHVVFAREDRLWPPGGSARH